MNPTDQTDPNAREHPPKPLGRKAYGSIPHLPGSRLGPGEHHIHAGQLRICTEKTRDRHDRITVTEKLDGANMAVANIEGRIVTIGRAGYEADTSPREHIRMFEPWVRQQEKRFLNALQPGEVLHGEWMAMAHGTIYNLPHEPFVIFDLTQDGKRVNWTELTTRCNLHHFTTPRLISDGDAISLEAVIPELKSSGHGVVPPDTVEGAVWRVERRDKFDFLAKWLRPDKEDGKYIPEISERPTVWLWHPQLTGAQTA